VPYKQPIYSQPGPPWKLRLTYLYCEGDTVVLTIAVKAIHDLYPGQYETLVDAPGEALFYHHPLVRTNILRFEGALVNVHHHEIDHANETGKSFAQVVCENIGPQIERPLHPTTDRPQFFWTEQERAWTPPWGPGPFCLVNATDKQDYSAKYAGWDFYNAAAQRIMAAGVKVVQIGKDDMYHRKIERAVDITGKTNLRQLMVATLHASFTLCGVTLLCHISAGCSTPCILMNTRETASWIAYPNQYPLNASGHLPCCPTPGLGCWKARTVALGDGRPYLDRNLCELPVLTPCGEWVPSCYNLPGVTDVDEVMKRVDQIMAARPK
jgi:hypothetical protein